MMDVSLDELWMCAQMYITQVAFVTEQNFESTMLT